MTGRRGDVERAAPDVLLMQETKLSDDDAPVMAFAMAGYQLVHHGEGRWNGVAIASRLPMDDVVVTNFGDGPVRDSRRATSPEADEEDFDPFDEARMVSAVCGGIRFVSLYAPNGRVVGSPFYEGKLRWFERLRRWLDETAANQIDSDARLQDGRIMGAMDDDLDGKLQKAELRGQFGKNLLARFDMIDANKDGVLDKAEMSAAMKAMGGRRQSAAPPPAGAGTAGGK